LGVEVIGKPVYGTVPSTGSLGALSPPLELREVMVTFTGPGREIGVGHFALVVDDLVLQFHRWGGGAHDDDAVTDGEKRKPVLPFPIRKITVPSDFLLGAANSGLPKTTTAVRDRSGGIPKTVSAAGDVVSGLPVKESAAGDTPSGLPKMPLAAGDGVSRPAKNSVAGGDLVSGVPENTCAVGRDSGRFHENTSAAAGVISRLPENRLANGGWLCQLPGRIPDSDDGLSGLPGNMRPTVGRLPCLPKETPESFEGIFLLTGNTPEAGQCFFTRGSDKGNMGVGGSLWVVQPKFIRRGTIRHHLLRDLSGEVLKNLQKNAENQRLTLFCFP
jgi:hypothetical protein